MDAWTTMRSVACDRDDRMRQRKTDIETATEGGEMRISKRGDMRERERERCIESVLTVYEENAKLFGWQKVAVHTCCYYCSNAMWIVGEACTQYLAIRNLSNWHMCVVSMT